MVPASHSTHLDLWWQNVDTLATTTRGQCVQGASHGTPPGLPVTLSTALLTTLCVQPPSCLGGSVVLHLTEACSRQMEERRMPTAAEVRLYYRMYLLRGSGVLFSGRAQPAGRRGKAVPSPQFCRQDSQLVICHLSSPPAFECHVPQVPRKDWALEQPSGGILHLLPGI